MLSIRRLIDYSVNRAREIRHSSRSAERLYGAWKEFMYPAPTGIREIKRLNPRRSNMVEPRINLLIPKINKEQVYGGISTALKFFDELSQPYKNVRLIPDVPPSSIALEVFSDYKLVSLEDDTNDAKQIVSPFNPGGSTLAIGSGDIFVATYWTTAYSAQRWAVWQSQEFNQPVKPIVYLIQDYEPGFYSWSSEYLAARSTYEYKGPTIAVFNSDLLKEYFHMQNHRFAHEYSFDPTMNGVLRNLRRNLEKPKKSKQILVYGRPRAARNAFGLIVEALRIWRSQFSQASTWTVLSAGEPHKDIDLGDGVVMKSLGKLSLENYARVLNESAIGLSLMVSPHPSYPPLEMSHYGMWVITNNYENKNLSLWHDNIISLDDSSPESIAHNLRILCQRVEADPTSGWYGQSYLKHYLSDEPPFPFIEEIRGLLQKFD
jgi:hypothetical protein